MILLVSTRPSEPKHRSAALPRHAVYFTAWMDLRGPRWWLPFPRLGPKKAQVIEQWLATHAVSLDIVRARMGHASETTTALYVQAERRQGLQAAKDLAQATLTGAG